MTTKMQALQKQAENRTATTQWQPGTSGNPKGRPKGLTAAGEMRAAIAQAMPDIQQALIDAAKGGDVTAARVLIDRCLPALKPVELLMPLAVEPSAPAHEQIAQVLQAVADGVLPVSQALPLMTAMQTADRVATNEKNRQRMRQILGD